MLRSSFASIFPHSLQLNNRKKTKSHYEHRYRVKKILNNNTNDSPIGLSLETPFCYLASERRGLGEGKWKRKEIVALINYRKKSTRLQP